MYKFTIPYLSVVNNCGFQKQLLLNLVHINSSIEFVLYQSFLTPTQIKDDRLSTLFLPMIISSFSIFFDFLILIKIYL